MTRAARARFPFQVGYVGVALLVALVAASAPQRLERRLPDGTVARLLGPVASAASDLLWLRVDAARRSGDHAALIARANLALRLDPGATGGWDFLAHHQALYLGSALREANPQRRAAFLRAGLDTARRGELSARAPEQLAFLRGIVLQTHAENDPETAWPGGVAGLWTDAADAYARAADLGHAGGAAMSAAALVSARDAGSRAND